MISGSEEAAEVAGRIEALIQQDPGGRGLERWALKGHLLPAARSLLEAGHVLLTTGFFIKQAGAIETDGPPGALVLASALENLGKPVSIVADAHARRIMERARASLDTAAALHCLRPDRPVDLAALIRPDTTHFIAIERPGKARDGRHYSFRGEDISPWVAPTDALLQACRRRGIVTIAMGDGGNELGMGLVSALVDRHVAPDRAFSSVLPADFCLCAGVSNWAAYGKAALLSRLAGRNLLPAPERLVHLLAEIARSGAVDGVTGRCTATVDGLDSAWEQGVYRSLYALARNGRHPVPPP
jgi:hypothetical protein